MKRHFIIAWIAFGVLAFAQIASADEPGKGGKERPEAANPEQRGDRANRAEGDRPGVRPGDARPKEGRPGAMMRPGMGDVNQVVSRMMREFDKDGDQKLDAAELTALIGFMRERAMMGGPGGFMPGNQRPGGFEGRPGMMERGREADGNNEAGGVKPRRPPAE